MYASDGSSQENKACAYTAFKNCLKRALAFKREIPLRIFSGRASLLRMPAHSFTFRKQAFQKKYCTTSNTLEGENWLVHWDAYLLKSSCYTTQISSLME
jgi:hypothetical protein